jgi:GNAT superfamily N-acetyltransferase
VTAPSEPPDAALPEGARLRLLSEADLPAALLLSQEAGWNQVAADWLIFLELGEAYGLIAREGRLIATAATLPHGAGLAWISMVLVTAAYRRRGLANWLLRRCLDALLRRRLVPVLDATPAGRAVYLALGFRDCWSTHRLVARTAICAGEAAESENTVLRVIGAGDWAALLAYDRAAFGAERGAVLRRLAGRLPEAALVAERQGRIAGFLLGRNGRVMSQLGPLVAEDNAVARLLLARAFTLVQPPFAIDIADRHAGIVDWLGTLGFSAERPLIRMTYQSDKAFDDPARLFAIAGPELG